jgi:hypothetical protein
VVSFASDEAWGALLGVKTAKAGTTVAAAGGGALYFLLCSIQMTVVGEPCAGCSKNLPPIFTVVPMKFQLLHRAVKGTPVVSLNIVTHVVHIRFLARQIHNTGILPTAAASHPARLRRSLPTTALLFSNPTAPCVTTVTRTRLLACGRTSGQPKDG